MRYLSSVGLGLSVVFGGLLLALMAEIYYLLWWKRRWNNNNNSNNTTRDMEDHDRDTTTPVASDSVLRKLCWNTKSYSSVSAVRSTAAAPQQHQHLKSFNGAVVIADGASETELRGGGGPPRFLFPIKEETSEDLESEDDGESASEDDDDAVRGIITRSLNDLIRKGHETPIFLTPTSSPQFFFTPPLTPMTQMGGSSSYSHHCSPASTYNPFLESSTDAEFNRIKASPPPFFKFLKDAEEKLEKKKREEENRLRRERERVRGVHHCNGGSIEEQNGSFLRILVQQH